MIRTRAVVALAATAILLSACSSPAVDEEDAPDTGGTTPQTNESTEMFGCTQGILDYIAELSFPEAEPIDPAGFAFPGDVTIATAPECLVVDESAGVERYGAFFPGDGLAVIAEADAALDAAGYQQADEWGPYIWWRGGNDPQTAEDSISAGPQVIDGVDYLWIQY